jgi:hypothetical protein
MSNPSWTLLPEGPNESLIVTVAKSSVVAGIDHEQNHVVAFDDFVIRGVSSTVRGGLFG